MVYQIKHFYVSRQLFEYEKIQAWFARKKNIKIKSNRVFASPLMCGFFFLK
jgi:hypothetical protein